MASSSFQVGCDRQVSAVRFHSDERPREIVASSATPSPSVSRRFAPTVYVPHVQQTSRFVGPTVYTRIGMNFVIRTMDEPMGTSRVGEARCGGSGSHDASGQRRNRRTDTGRQVRNLRLYMLFSVVRRDCGDPGGHGIYGLRRIRSPSAHARSVYAWRLAPACRTC